MPQHKRATVRRKGVNTTHTYHGPGRRKRPGLLIRLLQKVPSWGWWIGGGVIVALYVWFFYYFFVGPFGFRWRALYGTVNYPEGYEIHGIDISHHQGRIDWDELKDNGSINQCPIRFVMIKATEGATQTDENFRDNFYQAREHGFTRGAYHFYSVHTPAYQQAAHFIKNVKLENGDLPPVLDVEHKPKNQTDEEFKHSVKLPSSTSIPIGSHTIMWIPSNIRVNGNSGSTPMWGGCQELKAMLISISIMVLITIFAR